MPKVYIKTFGCQMSRRDSEALAGLFLQRGYSLSDKLEDADVILVNTCSVRDHAENRAISFLGSLKKVTRSPGHQVASNKRTTYDVLPALTLGGIPQRTKLACGTRRNTKIIGLIGCMARNRGEELFKKMPHVDLICGPAQLDKIPGYIERIIAEGRGLPAGQAETKDEGRNLRIIELDDKMRNEEFYRASFRAEADHAQVVISTGCSNYCSYCIVPYVRGSLRPRAPDDIIDEIKRNVALGITKITLLGQNVNDYNWKLDSRCSILDARGSIPEKVTFVDLLRRVEKIEGLGEIDFVTSHPKNTSSELFKVMAESAKFKKHLHLPFQSGSNRILKLMNRGYNKEGYLKLANDFKKIVCGSLSTDLIVGFPTETEDDFLQTKDVLQSIEFRYAYIFKYSPRPGTKAYLTIDDVSTEDKERRHKILLDLQKEISLRRKNEAM